MMGTTATMNVAPFPNSQPLRVEHVDPRHHHDHAMKSNPMPLFGTTELKGSRAPRPPRQPRSKCQDDVGLRLIRAYGWRRSRADGVGALRVEGTGKEGPLYVCEILSWITGCLYVYGVLSWEGKKGLWWDDYDGKRDE